MAIRQHHTPRGIEEREPTEKELDQEFELFINGDIGKLILTTLQDLNPQDKEGIKKILRKNFGA
jgi:hypothetical protein